MKTHYTVMLSMLAGVAIGATAIQGLHAQAKKVYFITESEVLDKAAAEAYNPQVMKVIKDAGGGNPIVTGGKITSVLGTAPQRVGVTEFESVSKVQAWLDSAERKALAPSRDKAIKFTRQYIVEGN